MIRVSASEADSRPVVARLERDPMLLSGHRPFSRPREPRHAGRHQQGHCKGRRGAGAVGEDKLPAEEEGLADAVEVRNYGQLFYLPTDSSVYLVRLGFRGNED